VNASPSLSANTPDDAAMKVQMLTAMFDIIDVEGKRTGDEVSGVVVVLKAPVVMVIKVEMARLTARLVNVAMSPCAFLGSIN
jgi:hypothetical protein